MFVGEEYMLNPSNSMHIWDVIYMTDDKYESDIKLIGPWNMWY